MTNRPDSNSNSTNHHPLHPRDERETLSALFDGELPGDATRFALKRLDYDEEWREACGRWQMIGDALRGEATSAAPPGFASGVMRMLDAEVQAALVSSAAERKTASTVSASLRRRWIGGAALAASVAMAAVLVVRPFSETPSTATDTQVASGVAAPAATQVPNASPANAQMRAAASANDNPTTSVAAANVPSTTANHRAANRPSRATARAARSVVAPVRDQAVESTTAVAAAAPVPTGLPFHPPVDDIVTRPWPRSVLSDDNAAALTVGFGSNATASPPSLYPFEPRLPDQPVRPSTAEPQR